MGSASLRVTRGPRVFREGRIEAGTEGTIGNYLSPWEEEIGEYRVQGPIGPHGNGKASLACTRPRFKIPPPKTKQNEEGPPSQENSTWEPLSLSCTCLLLPWLVLHLAQGEIPPSCPLPGSLVGRVPSEENSQAWRVLRLPKDRASNRLEGAGSTR